MSFHLGQILITSRDPNALAQFLSDVFDLEMIPGQDSVKLHSPHLNILVLLAPQQMPVSAHMVLDFEFQDLQELQDFWQKIQFFKYRYQLPDHQEEKITQTKSSSYFILKDLDGRRWKFSHHLTPKA